MNHRMLLDVLSATIRWVARGTALLMVVLLLTFIVFEGFPPIMKQPMSVKLESICLLTTLAGLLLGLKWEGIGGLVTVAGMIGFNAVEIAVNQQLARGAFPLFFIPGALYLISWLMHRAWFGFYRHPVARASQ